ncbi:MAG: SAM-dependent chlorinase/fluorinase [Saprospiraceae bacterium]
MKPVTLTTDFGSQGYYLAALKRGNFGENPDLQLVDISHQVKPYDIAGAYGFEECLPSFQRHGFTGISVG